MTKAVAAYCSKDIRYQQMIFACEESIIDYGRLLLEVLPLNAPLVGIHLRMERAHLPAKLLVSPYRSHDNVNLLLRYTSVKSNLNYLHIL